mmetsp:Transcript_24639/g.41912  ORF Transcript_24639/g.41912 Transcript_24639/m.41912 type:complete len:89 (+) Transcript_24639:109-375(+)
MSSCIQDKKTFYFSFSMCLLELGGAKQGVNGLECNVVFTESFLLYSPLVFRTKFGKYHTHFCISQCLALTVPSSASKSQKSLLHLGGG